MIGELIVAKRKELGLSRKEVAKKFGISYNYLTLIETEKRNCSKKLKEKVAKFLGVNYDMLESDNQSIVEQNLIRQKLTTINCELSKLENRKELLNQEKQILNKKLVMLENGEI